jgi:hypothetical protein
MSGRTKLCPQLFADSSEQRSGGKLARPATERRAAPSPGEFPIQGANPESERQTGTEQIHTANGLERSVKRTLHRREGMGNHRRQSQQSRLELGLRVSFGHAGTDDLDY